MMRINAAGLALIKEFEGLRLKAYPDPGTGGVPWTIGIGTTVYPNGQTVAPGDMCTEQQALEYLVHDVQRFESSVAAMLRAPVNENQFSALVSFAYNVGTEALRRSTLLRFINDNRFADAAGEFGRWNMAAGKPLAGLARRRAAERELFLKPVSDEIQVGDFPPMQPVAAIQQPTERPMAPILAALLPSLISAIPQLGKLFGSGPKTDKTIAIAEKVAQVVVDATGATNLQAAVETINADPAKRDAATQAVQAVWYELQEIGGGIGAAREFSVRASAESAPFYKMPAFWISLALLPLLYGTVWLVLTGAEGFTNELRAAIASSVVTGVLGAVAGFWLGSSFTTSRSRGLGATPTTE
jgi:lysozyme